ncbi:MAG: pro-sigmaK processing inhibitor BofA [Clostridia bacterium]|nr:pro-sigmaK processing inhibitor BofA [Clostridia bacterium]
MDFTMILPILIGVAILFVVLKLLALPMKLIIKLVINGIVGGVIIFVVNLIGANFGFTIDLNWITALVVGILGVPGVVIVAILQFVL